MFITKQLEAVPVEFDNTDHFVFKCPDCDAVLEVCKVTTDLVTRRDGDVTRFFLKCPLCRGEGYRKVYWNNGIKV